MNDSLSVITNSVKDKDWFHSTELKDNGTIVVYAKYMSGDILVAVPDFIDKHQVLVHYARSKTATKNEFVSDNKPVYVQLPIPKIEELSSDLLERDITELICELDRLERVCGPNILQDVFYEIHDQQNSVTNLSAKFPEVRRSLEKLYDEFGFDVIYEEMDG